MGISYLYILPKTPITVMQQQGHDRSLSIAAYRHRYPFRSEESRADTRRCDNPRAKGKSFQSDSRSSISDERT